MRKPMLVLAMVLMTTVPAFAGVYVSGVRTLTVDDSGVRVTLVTGQSLSICNMGDTSAGAALYGAAVTVLSNAQARQKAVEVTTRPVTVGGVTVECLSAVSQRP